MKNTKLLIIVTGFFGDIVFASSIAKKIKDEDQFSEVHYFIRFPQMKRLLLNNPYIDQVYVHSIDTVSESDYDKIVTIGQFSFDVPPPYEAQSLAGIKNPDTSYKLYTEYEYDIVARNYIEELRKEYNKKVVCIMSNWKHKTYIFTEEEYTRGIDVPNLGYGGKHRDLEFILSELKKVFYIVEVGFPQDVNQNQTIFIEDDTQKSVLFECSLMKYCDAFIGTEGGLCNLAAGVGTKTIITGDFVHQLYGWNGVLKKIKEPKLGPIHYFKNNDHVELDPYLTDAQVVEQIIKNII
jgi:hypothetical protein